MTQRIRTPQSIWRWYLVPCFQKSTEDQAQAVECVEEDCCNQTGFTKCHPRGLISANDCVVGAGIDTDHGRIKHVHQQIKKNNDTGDSVSHPGPHAFMAAV